MDDDQAAAKRVIDLPHPSIVQLQHIGPEEVSKFSREGANLKIVLTDGNVIVIQNFFTQDDDGARSDLVLVDDYGVMWWGQYGKDWAGFDFAEIESDSAVIPPWLWWGLAALGVAGAAAALAGGDDGGHDNAVPVARADVNSGPEDGGPLTGNVLSNDSDADGNGLKVSGFSVDTNDDGTLETFHAGDTATIDNVGKLTLNDDGSYTFTPDANYNGKVPNVTYTVDDGNGGTATGDLSLTVTPVNDPPVAQADTGSGAEDNPVTGHVLTNDSDLDGDTLTVTQFTIAGDATIYTAGQTATVAGVGTLQINSDGSYTFTPAADWNGSVPQVTYSISDGAGGTDTATLDIEVTPVNDAPVATTLTDQYSDDSDTITGLDVSSHFNDVDGDSLTYTATDLPDGLTIDPNTGIISGTINHSASTGGAHDIYDVTVTATDPDGETASSSFTWTVGNLVPVALGDSNSGAEDGGDITGNVLTNDSDPDGDPLTVTQFSLDANGDGIAETYQAGDTITVNGKGQLTINSDGSYSFTPDTNWHGTVPQVTYTVSDGEGGTDTATLDLTVTSVNDAPTTVPGNLIADQTSDDSDTITTVDVSGSFTDLDGDTLTYSVSGLPAGLTIDAGTGVISGTIDHSASQGGTAGVYTVTVTATDPDGKAADSSFTWTVNNPAPMAQNDANSGAEDGGDITGNVITDATTGDGDPDGDTLTVTSFTVAGDTTIHPVGSPVTIADVGKLTLNDDGSYTFTPDADYNGAVPQITYTVSDSEGGTDTATLDIDITPVNDAPVAIPIADQNGNDGAVIAGVDVSGSFSDVDGDTLLYSASGLPAGLTIDSGTGIISGTIDHSASQSGPYTVTVTADDGDGGTVQQQFTWNVANPAPVAQDDSNSGAEDGGDITGNVITDATTGDSDPDGDTLTVTQFTVAGDATVYAAGTSAVITGVGTLTINSDGSYTFTPETDYNGPVPQATYTVSDGEGGTDTAALDLTVTSVNDAPVAIAIADQNNDDSDTGVSVDVSGSFSDVDGDTLTYSATGLPSGLTIDPTTGVIGGTIDHSASQSGPYTVTVTADDGNGGTAQQQFTWNVANPAPVAQNDSNTGAEDTTITGNVITDPTTGDGDPDGDTLSVTQFTIGGQSFAVLAGSSIGNATNPGTSHVVPGVGTVTVASDGSYSFTPDADWNGSVPTIAYTLSDGEGGTDTATLDIEVTPVNDAPAATPITDQNNDDSDTITPVDVSGNFSDVDGDTLTYSATGLPTGLTIDSTTGVISGTINHSASQSGPYTVTVTADDGHGGTVQQQFTWNIINPAPVAQDDSNSGAEDGGDITGNVITDTTTGDSDPDGDTLTVTQFTVAGDTTTYTVGDTATITGVGTVTISSDGGYSFTPDADWNGSVPQVTYTLSDGEGGTDTATLDISVTPVNDPPVAQNDSNSGDEDHGVTGNVLDNDSDIDGDPLTVTQFTVDGTIYTVDATTPGTATISGVGKLTIDSDGNYTFTPDTDWNGTVPTVTYTVSDGEGDTDTAELNITVDPVNDAPVATPIADQSSDDNDTITPVDVSGSFSDVDGDTLAYTATGLPAGLAIDANTGIISGTIDHSASRSGPYTVTVTADDGNGGTVQQQFTWNVANPAPVAQDDSNSGAEDGGDITGNVISDATTGDSDPDGDTLSVTEFSLDANGDGTTEIYQAGDTVTVNGKGQLTINSDGSYSFAPAADYNGTVPTVTYTVSDSEGGTATATLDITVNAVNDAPVTEGAVANQTSEDAQTGIDLDVITGLFDDVDGDTLTYTVDGLPTGLIFDAGTGHVTGTIDHSASQGGVGGVYTVTVTATDGDGLTAEQTFTWTVTNPEPVANDDAVTTDEDTPITGNVLDNDSDADGTTSGDPDFDPLTVTQFTVAGDPNTYTVDATTPGTATITGVGTLTINSDGSYSFTPAADWNGTVPTVTYTVDDGDNGTATADLNITVDAVNDAPVTAGTILDQTSEDAETGIDLDVITGLFNDVDGDTLTYTVDGLPTGLTFDAGTGHVTGALDHSASQGGTGGVYTVTVTATDGDGQTATQTFDWTVKNPVPVAQDDSGITNEDTPITGNVLANDSDTDGTTSGATNLDPLTVTGFEVDTDNDGTPEAFSVGHTATIAGIGALTVASDGSYSFTPVADWNGTVPTVTYTINDGDGGTTTADLNITVAPVNDAPTVTSNAGDAEGDVVEAGIDAAGAPIGTATATGTLTGGDVDAGDTLTWSLDGSSTGTYGSLTLGANGQWTYTLDDSKTDSLNAGETKQDTFTAVVTDALGATAEQVITITVTGSNDAPTVTSDVSEASGSVIEAGIDATGTAIGTATATGALTGDDVDAEDDSASLTWGLKGSTTSIETGTYGSLILGTDGKWTYTLDDSKADSLNAGETKQDTFTAVVTDKQGATAEQVITITVTGSNDAPTVTSNVSAASGSVVEAGIDAAGTAIGTATATGTLTGDDVDAEDDPASLTWSLDGSATGTEDGAYGSLTLGANGQWTYTLDDSKADSLNAGETKQETFTAVVTDAQGATAEQVITITVTGSNDAPVVVPGSPIDNQTNEDAQTGISVDVKGAFSDVDDTTLTYSASGLPAGLSIDATTGIISGTLDHSASQGGTSGEYTVTVTADDGHGGTVDQTFTWTVTNPAPVAVDDAASGDEDTTLTGNVLTNDSDPDGDALSVKQFTVDSDATIYTAGQTATIAGIGALTVNSDGSYSFTPAADYNGTVPTVTYTVSDGEGGTNTAQLNIAIDPVNDAPVTESTISPQTSEDAQTGIDLDVITGLFSDVDGDTLTYTVDGLPTGLIFDAGTGHVTGTIDNSASQGGTGGVYTVTVTATDGDGLTAEQTFTWTVTNPAPVAVDDAASGDEDTILTGNVITDATTGDNDADGDTLSVTQFEIDGQTFAVQAGSSIGSATNPGTSHVVPGVGTVTVAGDGSYSFTPDADWNGSVPTITYTLSDGEGGTDTATLDIAVTPVNDAPVAEGSIPDQSSEDAQTGINVDVTGAFSDVDDTTLTYSASGLPAGLSITTDGTISGILDNSASQGGTGGVYTVTVTATDGGGLTANQTFTWTVTNPAPIAQSDSGSAEEDNNATGNVLGNDSDPDNDTLTVTQFTVAGDTTTYTAGDTATITWAGTLQINADGSYTFTPDANWSGDVPTVTYTVSDGEGGTDTATLDLTVTPVNDAPIPMPGNETISNQSDSDSDTITPVNITGNFADVDDATLTYTATGLPDGLTLDLNTGIISGTINHSASQGGAGADGVYTVTVTAKDPSGETTDSQFTWTVTNPAPIAQSDSGATGEDTPITGNVLTNDSDPDGDTLTMAVSGFEVDTNGDGTSEPFSAGDTATISGVGTLTINSDGSYSFTPAAGYQGPVPQATYTLSDGEGGTDTATLDLSVIGVDIVDDASPAGPTTGDDVLASIDDLTSVAISGQIAAGGTLTALSVSDVNNLTMVIDPATVTINPDGTFSTTADLSALQDGPLKVTMTAEDAFGNSATTTDDILKDTVTQITIDPLLVVDGAVPTITGTGEPGSTVALTIDGGTPVDVTVQIDGTWSYTPASPLATTEVTLAADATDPYGNTASDSGKVAGLTVTDQESGDTADVLVDEAALSSGSDSTSTAETVTSTFTLGTTEGGIDSIVLGGSVTSGALSGGTTVTLAQLQSASTGSPVGVTTTEYGTLEIVGYDSTTGVVTYSYTLTGNTTDHSATTGNDIVRENIQLAVVDHDGDTRVHDLVVGVKDDVPTATDDTGVTVTEGDTAAATGNLLDNDVQGADGARVHEIFFTNSFGNPDSRTFGETDTSITVETSAGELTVHSDGSWTYQVDTTVEHDQPTHDSSTPDDFSYTLIDGDGDISAQATQPITILDTAPVMGTPDDGTVEEKNLPSGTDPDSGSLAITGSLHVTPGQDSIDTKFTTTSAPAGLTSGGVDLEYDVSSDGHTLIAYRGAGRTAADQVFTVTLDDPTTSGAGYTFTLQSYLDHGGAASLGLDFDVQTTDSDGDSASGTFKVTVDDDAQPSSLAETVAEDSSVTFNATADATPANVDIFQNSVQLTGTANGDSMDYKTANGTVTVNTDGTITYTPDGNYSGEETFRYQIANSDSNGETTVTMTVTPVSDAPTLTVDNTPINTPEDTVVALGLNAPVIADATDQNNTDPGDEPERLGVITLDGIPEGAELQDDSGTTLFTGTGSDHVVTIVLSDGPTVTGVTGDLTMTRAEFEALQIKPPADSSSNFTVGMSVSSYEVDASGNIAQVDGTDVAGAPSTTSVEVYVQAATDNAAMTFDTTKTTGITNVDDVTYGGTGGDTEATVTLKEDTSFNVTDILKSSFTDLDGSEVRSITVTNNTGAAILIDGQTLANGASKIFDASTGSAGQTGGIDSFPDISVGAVHDFSGDLNGIDITLNAQDKDADGYFDGASVVPGTTDGIAEADTSDNSVTLNLRVDPVADDVTVADVSTTEDTAVAFLSGVAITDTGTGTEVVNTVTFELPSGWMLSEQPTPSADWSISGTGTSGDPYVITFTDGVAEATRETLLDGFKVLPPSDRSADAAISVDIKTTDSNTVGGSLVSDSKTTNHQIQVTVTPQAEIIGSDTNGVAGDDLTMHGSETYTTPGTEDLWFHMDSDGITLASGWANQDTDGSEQTFARLTPSLIAGDGSHADAIGSQFRWSEDGGTTWEVRTFNGTPIDVPIAYLDTLQFKAAADFSGKFSIGVQAYTVDIDPDDGSKSTELSGSATLTNLLIKPEADDVTLTLNGHATGVEDTAIPLTIHPRSSDPSETFNVTISDIPAGATITYDGTDLAVTGGSVTIDAFDSGKSLTITPPHNSNDDFTLHVSADSVDTLTITGDPDSPYTSTNSSGAELNIDVAVRGVADAGDVTLTTPTVSYSEADLDSGTKTVNLSDLASVALTDTDGSEALTIRVTGLPEGFAPSEGILLDARTTGGDRVWVLTQDQYNAATISSPANYSGTITFQVGAVTTENDGNSLTGATQDVSFEVTPSPEAITTTTGTVAEDVRTATPLNIVYQHGDNDETLTAVRIEKADVDSSNFTLYLGGVALADALTAGTITEISDGGVDYYVLTGEQAGQLAALGTANLDGDLGSFDFQYQITDAGYGGTPATTPATSGWQDGSFTLTATAVTDAPTAAIDDINNFLIDSIGVNAAQTVTVHFGVTSPDTDGSEHLIRIVIDGVPSGVTVEGGHYTGNGQWLLIYDGASAKAIGSSGLQVPVVFDVTDKTGTGSWDITMTAQVQDNGEQSASGAAVESDSATWHLDTNLDNSIDTGGKPALINDWTYNNADATEDTTFQLSDVMSGQITVQDTGADNVFTITLTGLPADTVVSGMTHTVVAGVDVWTASTSVTGDSATANAALDSLMDSIIITPPPNSNNNNAAGALQFDATLTTSVPGAVDNGSETISPTVPVTPVTDDATLAISLDTGVETDQLNESDSSIPITLTVSNAADGTTYGSIIDGKLYVQISSTEGDLNSGTLTVDGSPEALEAVSGVPGLTDGNYYVIDNVSLGDTLDLVYTPDRMTQGDVQVNAWVQNIETGSTAVLSNGAGTLTVNVSNDGVTVSSSPVTGSEVADSKAASAIELTGLSVELNDNDGSEQINTILLSGPPDGFLVYTGADASSAALAANAGGTSGTNTWVLSDGGALPGYIGIVPPQHWSGTLTDLQLVVSSGETALTEARTDTVDLADMTVDPVADGLTLDTTHTFGKEGDIIPLNLNASMKDALDASVTGAADESQEQATIEITGLGEYASFYLDGTAIDASQVSYSGGVYTVTGLSQDDLANLGFIQAKSALADQDTGTDGMQLGLEAWTVESGNNAQSIHESSTITINMSEQLPTTGDDTLLWTGQAIDGLAGNDTIRLRGGEDLSGADLAGKLTNIETIDLGLAGVNHITDLTPDEADSILGGDISITDVLTITGNADDSISLNTDLWSTTGTAGHDYVGTTTTGGTVYLDIHNPVDDQFTSNPI